MQRGRIGEIVAMALIAVLIALGGNTVLLELGRLGPLGILITAGALIAALVQLYRSYDPSDPGARVNASRSGAYACAAIFAFLAVVMPARWNFGACIAAAEVALVFDIVATARRSATKEN